MNLDNTNHKHVGRAEVQSDSNVWRKGRDYVDKWYMYLPKNPNPGKPSGVASW